MRVIFSGIQPTGIPHLGNYLGALVQWIRLAQQKDTQCLFSIVDLHAITLAQDPATLATHTRDMAASLLAVGIDPATCTLFLQSHVRPMIARLSAPHSNEVKKVKEHTELMWMLGCVAGRTGWLGRMTQWKVHSSVAVCIVGEHNVLQ